MPVLPEDTYPILRVVADEHLDSGCGDGPVVVAAVLHNYWNWVVVS